MQIMTTSAVSQLLYLFDEAFQGTDWHSLLGNLHSVTPEDWLWVPSGGQRSIRDIIQHVGGCKFMYHNHTFGDAQLTWDDPLVEGRDTLSTIAQAYKEKGIKVTVDQILKANPGLVPERMRTGQKIWIPAPQS